MIQPRIYPFDLIRSQGFDLDHIPIVPIKAKGKRKLTYVRACCGFDIETTNIYEKKTAYMYIWQFSLNDIVVIGRTWDEFIELIEILKKQYKLSSSKRLIIWIHNLPFEFQFIRRYFNFTNVFAKELRKPLYAVIDDCIELRDSAAISGGSLAQLAKDYTETQKLVGDLDYSVLRSSKDKLSAQELQYCINDVVILSEWADYIFKTYIEPLRYIPLTKTGILRKEIKNGVSWNAKKLIFAAYPETYGLYSDMMLWLFRGGYVHANITFIDKVIDPETYPGGVTGVDLTSSYPAQMNQKYYPVTPFQFVNPKSWKQHLTTRCCILKLKFKNINAKLAHSIESKSKCIYISPDANIDNGRVLSASEMIVMITELDFEVYTWFYEWESVECLSCQTSTRGRLPRYVLNVLNKAYIKKNELKKAHKNDTPEYAAAKAYCNSAYGCLVTRLAEREIILDDLGEWDFDETMFDYDKERKKAFLLPQWGCYCTSHARHTLLKMVYRIECERERYGGDVIYCDTDSIKMINFDKHKHLIDEYNAETMELMRKECKRQELPFEHFADLGCFDLEYTGATMKTLGAKRYITRYADGHTAVTIAGLPKSSLVEYCEKYDKNIFVTFADEMLMNVEVSMKNASCYNDEPTSDIINGVVMTEQSSLCIYPIEFTMKLSQIFKNLIDNIKKESEKYERRIY